MSIVSNYRTLVIIQMPVKATLDNSPKKYFTVVRIHTLIAKLEIILQV